MATLTKKQFEEQYGKEVYSQFNPLQTFENKPTAFERVSKVISEAGQKVQENISGTGEFSGQSAFRRGTQATAEAFTAVPETAIALSPEPVREGIAKVGEAIGSGFGKLIDFIGGNKQLQKFVQENPDTARAIEEVAGTLSAGGEISGTILGAKGSTKSLEVGSNLTKSGLAKIADATRELKGINVPGPAGIDLATKAGLAPDQIMQRVARISKGKQAKFNDLSGGESVGQYLVNRNIFGGPDDIVDSLYKRMKESKSRVDDSLKTVQGEFKADSVKTALDQLIERDTRVSTPGALAPDSKRITELFKKYNQRGLTLSEVNEVKRLYERNVKVDYLNFGNPQTDKLAQANNIDSALRNLVTDKASKAGIDTVRQLNKETQLAKQLLDDLGAEYAGQAGNNAIGLTDALFLAEAAGGSPSALATFAIKKGLSNKKVMSAIAEKLSKDAGSKANLPEVPVQQGLTGYLKFLETNQIDQ